jgi:hypothetical protein
LLSQATLSVNGLFWLGFVANQEKE